jgi:hypothetical protein
MRVEHSPKSTLFSHDESRYEKSLAWFDRFATQLDVEAILAMGCGAGFTGGFRALVFVDDGEAHFSAEDAAKIYRR